MERPIIILSLPEEIHFTLRSKGFHSVEDIERYLITYGEVPPFLKDIFEEYKIQEKISAFKQFSKIESAADKLFNSSSPISIFHRGLTKILGGGLPVGQITELCGPPGSGKTQMCLQFCIDVQIPIELGGSEGEALFITTDFGFHPERLQQMCLATINHFNTAFTFDGTGTRENILKKLTLNSLLNGVKVFQTIEFIALQEIIDAFDGFVKTNLNVKLVVIDSFSLPLIMDILDAGARTKIVADFLKKLLDLAVKYNFAVVLTNQLMTIVNGKYKSVFRPALGQAYAHRIHNRLILNDNRIYLTKSNNFPQVFTRFKITEEGIR